MINDYLLQTHRPAQYIAGEWNVSKKPFEGAVVKFGICFPDLYEVGMSNLGMRILYGVISKIDDCVCERFFSPEADMEDIIRKHNLEICSLESKVPMNQFDMIGFSLGYELLYTNVLNMLQLGGVPLRSDMRDCSHPLVIGGGPAALNPEPVHAFFDLFLIGEAEEAIIEIIDLYRKFKSDYKLSKMSRRELLIKLSGIDGVYVPSLYDVTYDAAGVISEFKRNSDIAPQKVKKRVVKNLEHSFFPLEWLVPYVQIIHDRITLEIMRGCPNRCRFCQARNQYYPLRIRSEQAILELADTLYKKTGYEEVSLGGLSVSDYPGIEALLQKLLQRFKGDSVALALPSLKAKSVVGNLSEIISTIRKTGFTFAPEAGSQRLRNLLAKDFDLNEFFQAIEKAYSHGYQHVKLYFMIGLPGEKQQDLDEIIKLSVEVSELRRKVDKGPAQVNLSINTIIPKPHTCFQWLGMLDLDGITQKQNYLRDICKSRRIKMSFHNKYMSFIEGVLSRGDRRLSEVIYSVFNKGARFDSWSAHFDFTKWDASFKEAGIDPGYYLKQKSLDEILPWGFIDIGVSSEFLIEEFNKVIDIKEDKRYNSVTID